MNIEENNKETILDEFEFILNKMSEFDKLETQLYYFSASFGIVRRIFNIDFDSTLVVIHHVLQNVHSAFVSRLDAMRSNREVPIVIDLEMVKELIELLRTLYNAIKSGDDVHPILDKFIILSYATTGNGYYLKEKGELNIK